jgi:hypothetical protein
MVASIAGPSLDVGGELTHPQPFSVMLLCGRRGNTGFTWMNERVSK